MKIHFRTVRERELATVDANRKSVGMLNPIRDKTKGTYRGGEGTTAYSYGLFSCRKIHFRIVRERELATVDANRRAVGMLNPMRDKTKGTYRGGEGATPLTTTCPEDRRG